MFMTLFFHSGGQPLPPWPPQSEWWLPHPFFFWTDNNAKKEKNFHKNLEIQQNDCDIITKKN